MSQTAPTAGSGGAYYNEFDPKAAAWLRELIKQGHIAPGVVDERSISEIKPHELHGYTQCHFFAGVGGWSLALRLAGWPDSRPVWTGSCPCQPFSVAGQGRGTDDERHLWPAFFRLIEALRPSIVFGEQVASTAVVGSSAKPTRRKPLSTPEQVWLDGVFADLEGARYACGAADIPAAGVGSPHPRQRLFWVADAGGERVRCTGRGEDAGSAQRACGEEWEQRVRHDSGPDSSPDGLAHTTDSRPIDAGSRMPGTRRQECLSGVNNTIGGMVLPDSAGRNEGRQGAATAGYGSSVESAGSNGGMGDTESIGRERRENNEDAGRRECASGCSGPWSDYDICHFTGPDAGKARRIESGTLPLAHGIPGRVGLLRGYGNAIVPQVAAEFIQAFVTL